MVDFDKDDLKALCPGAREDYLDAFVASKQLLDDLDISDTAPRFCAFIAQVAHESGGLRLKEENLNYSAKRLMQVWPSRFKSLAMAEKYARNPEKLANFTYDDANRDDKHKLGNTKPGDGWKFRGRGLIQITGRHEYERVSKLIGEDIAWNPDRAADPMVAVAVAAHLFVDKGCCTLADKGDFTGITKKINGGTIGLKDRTAYHIKAKAIFKDTPAKGQEAVPPPASVAPPASIVQSTEAQASAVSSSIGSGGAAIELGNAMSKTVADGRFSALEFLGNVVSSPWFWGCLIIALLGVYGVLRRRYRLLQWGV